LSDFLQRRNKNKLIAIAAKKQHHGRRSPLINNLTQQQGCNFAEIVADKTIIFQENKSFFSTLCFG
jgi:hypothetical protein